MWPAPTPARNCFNPHPTFRPDATCPCALATSATWMFQSSSDLQAGCNTNQAGKYGSVSLFQSSSDLQAGCNTNQAGKYGSVSLFQSSSDLQAGCNPSSASSTASCLKKFQSSSDLQAGCNPARGSFRTSGRRFQSSSDLQAGCNRPHRRRPQHTANSFNPHPTFRPDATKPP